MNSQLQQAYRETRDGDAWGNCMQWLFALADYMSDRGVGVPPEWQYRPGLGGADTDSYVYQSLAEIAPSDTDLQTFAAVMWRLRGILEARGLSY